MVKRLLTLYEKTGVATMVGQNTYVQIQKAVLEALTFDEPWQ